VLGVRPPYGIARKRIMLKGAYRNAMDSKKEFVKRRFLDLYDTQKELASVTQKERDKFDKLAIDIHAELDRNHFQFEIRWPNQIYLSLRSSNDFVSTAPPSKNHYLVVRVDTLPLPMYAS
jgi:hypothetical protein